MSTGSFVMQAIPLLMVFAVFYCVVIRPGRVREIARRAMVEALAPGDRVVLASGMLGSFVARHGEEVEVEIADGLRVRVTEDGVKEKVSPAPAAATGTSPETPSEAADQAVPDAPKDAG